MYCTDHVLQQWSLKLTDEASYSIGAATLNLVHLHAAFMISLNWNRSVTAMNN